jgi:signal transduction histidine kinase
MREIDRQKDELLSIVSHQLATPVSSVKWYLEMMQDGDVGKLTKEQSEHVSTAQSVITDLVDLVQMILDVSRIQLGRMKLDMAETDLGAFTKEILNVIEPKAKEKKVEFNVSLPKKWPKSVFDKRLLKMTIENLLSNAIKYTPEKGKVDWKMEIRDGNLYCEVKDTGCGIPKKDQSRIFTKLFRASNVRDVDGNGFGLYIAKGAVESQDGRIWFESGQGKGTKFMINLPLKPKNKRSK